MKKWFFLLAGSLLATLAHADLAVFATVPEWGALAGEIGGGKAKVYTATSARQDPHRIEARPSLLAQARRAQLVVATGADLEIGWLPLVLRDAGNAAIQPGLPGYFEAAQQVRLRDVPKVLDRAHGDVHAAGNPHLHLDPRNLLAVGEALSGRMAELDPANATVYQQNWQKFRERWQAAISRWEAQAAPLKGVPVLEHHTSYAYLAHWLGLRIVGALEPKPGVEPSSSHLSGLLQRQQGAQAAKLILRTAYQAEGPSQWLAAKAGIPALQLPYTVGGTAEAGDLFGLFDDTVQRLLKAL